MRGLSLRESSYLTALPFIAMALCSPLGGVVSDFVTRHHGKRWGRCGIAVLGMGLTGVFMACGHAVGNPRLASVVLAAGAGSLFFSQSTYWSVTADIAGESAGSVSGIIEYGRTDRRGGHRYADPLHRPHPRLGLGRRFRCGVFPLRLGRPRLAAG